VSTSIGLGDIPVSTDDSADKPGPPREMTAVRKALMILAAFRGGPEELGLSELARRAGVPKSTAFRLLSDLASAGFVERVGPTYRLGLSLFELGARVSFNRPNGLREVAMHDLSQLYARTGLTAHLAVLSGSEIIWIERVGKPPKAGVLEVPGARVPATCTAAGKAIIAFSPADDVRAILSKRLKRLTSYSINESGRLAAELQTIQTSGVAQEREESVLGRIGLAAPILNNGWAIAAIGVNGPIKGPNWKFAEAAIRQAGANVSQLYSMVRGDGESALELLTGAIPAGVDGRRS
jgi:DNA-binding IclR family transcriptional regulator